MTKTTMSPNFLQALQIFTELVVEEIRQHLSGLAILDVLLSVQKPVGDLVLARVLHNSDDLFDLFFAQLTSPPVQINIGLLEDKVGVTTTNTLDGGQGEHDASLSINVGVENTKNVLEVWGNNQRHLAIVA